MSASATRNPTYRDILSGLKSDKTRDPDIVELFIQQNPILDDLVVKEANSGTTNLSTIRSGLPTPVWTALYQGVPPSKGSKKQVKDASGMLESMLEIDKRLFDIAPDKEAFMLDEAESHAEAMGQAAASQIIYGNVADDAKGFNGLTMRMNTIGGSDDQEAPFYCLDGSKSSISTAALRSIWLVGHGTKAVHAFYPKGTSGGLQRSPVREVDIDDGDGNAFTVKRQNFKWDLGLVVKDFRFCGRIANIESDAMFAATGQPDYLELIRRLVIRVKSEGVKQCFYMDKLTFEMVSVMCSRKTQANAITQTTLFERPVQSLYGIPVRVMQAMNVNETEATT